MRTQEEIVEKIKNSNSFLGFETSVWLEQLDFEHAKQFLKEEAGVTAEKWAADGLGPKTREQTLEEMKNYMKFGWSKVQDHRGISAGRTIEKMAAWAWLLGEEELHKTIEEMHDGEGYREYGAPILKVICEKFGWPIPQDESTQRMMRGVPCVDDCDMGCA